MLHIYVCTSAKPGSKLWQRVQEPLRKLLFNDLQSLLAALRASYNCEIGDQQPPVQYKMYLQGPWLDLTTASDYKKFLENLARWEEKDGNSAAGVWISCPVSTSSCNAEPFSLKPSILKQRFRRQLASARRSPRPRLR